MINLRTDVNVLWFILIVLKDIPYLDKNRNIKKYEVFDNKQIYNELKINNILDEFSLVMYDGETNIFSFDIDIKSFGEKIKDKIIISNNEP